MPLTCGIFLEECAWDLLEGAIAFDDTRLDVFEEVSGKGLEIVDAELLDPNWSDDRLVGIVVHHFLSFACGLQLLLRLLLRLIDTLDFLLRLSAHVGCQLVDVALLQVLNDESELSFVFVAWQSFLFLYDKRIPILQSIFGPAFEISGDFQPFFEPPGCRDKF